eukprot:3598613-Pleurochrysis_carterae.AAC.1
MEASYRKGDISVRSEMILNGIVTSGPEQAIINVSMRLNNNSYRLDRGQGWEPQILARLNRNGSLASPIESTSTVDHLAIDPQMKLKLLDQVCISPIQRVPLYHVCSSANRYYMPSDGFYPMMLIPSVMVTIARHIH